MYIGFSYDNFVLFFSNLRWLTISQSLQVILVLLGTYLYKRVMKAIRMSEGDRMGIRGFSNGMTNSTDYLDRSYKEAK